MQIEPWQRVTGCERGGARGIPYAVQHDKRPGSGDGMYLVDQQHSGGSDDALLGAASDVARQGLDEHHLRCSLVTSSIVHPNMMKASSKSIVTAMKVFPEPVSRNAITYRGTQTTA
jgi:hypothetical protein